MLEPLIKAIQDSVVPTTISFRGETYASTKLSLPPAEPTIDTLHVSTLTGIKDYLLSTLQDYDFDELGYVIHVKSPTLVNVVTQYSSSARSRHIPAEASCKDLLGVLFPFGQFIDQEQFIIELQSKFLDAGDRARVLQYVGNISNDNSVQAQDDGVSQSTTVKKALGRVGHKEFENPVTLAPYRTFHEVQQPFSDFVLRMREGRDGVELALFDSEAGRWKLDALQSIKAWFESNLDLEELNVSVIA